MIYAIVWFCVAATLGTHAAQSRGSGWFLLWPALSCFLVGIAYAGIGSAIFGKRPDGRISSLHVIVMLPFLLFTWIVWHLTRCIEQTDAWNEVTPNLLIGRRVLPYELPQSVDLVVDLTAEFMEPLGVRTQADYRSLPTLDAMIPSLSQFTKLVHEVADHPGTTYIHCAQGSGRTGTFAAAVLLARGIARDSTDAIQRVRTARPGVRLKPGQRRFLSRFAAESPRPSH